MKQKRLWSIVGIIAVLLILYYFISGSKNNIVETDKNDQNFLNYDYDINANTKYFLEGDEFDTYVLGGPYYLGQEKLVGGGLDDYEKLRENKVKEAISITDETFLKSKELITEMVSYKGALVYLWGEIIKEDKEFKKDENKLSEYLIEYKLKEDGLINYYQSIDTSSKIKAVAAGMEHRKTVASVKLSDIVIEDMNRIMTYSSLLFDKYEKTDNKKIKDALTLFDKEMEKLGTSLDKMRELQTSTDSLAIALKQLEEAEKYIGIASIINVENKLPEIKEKINNLKAKKGLTDEDIAFYKEYVKFFEDYTTGYKYAMGKSSSGAVSYNTFKGNMIFPNANAGLSDYYNSALDTLKSGAKTVIKSGAKVVDKGLTRTGVKDKYQKAKKALGIGVSSLDAATKSGFDMIFGYTNGLERKEIGKSIMDNFKKFDDGLKKGNSGADVYKQAGEYLSGIDETGEALAGGAVEKLIGEGYTSKAAGWLGKTAGNLFTGFGQGVYKVANPESSDGEIAEGVLDIGLSFIGGSKTLAKGSKLISGVGNTTKQLGKSGLGYVGRIPKEGLKNFVSNSLKKTVSDGIENSMKELTKKITTGFTNMVSAGYKELGTNLPKVMNTSYKDFVKEQFKNTLGGYIKAVKGVIGKNAGDFFDNAFGNEVDGWLKGVVKEAINETINDDKDEEEEDSEKDTQEKDTQEKDTQEEDTSEEDTTEDTQTSSDTSASANNEEDEVFIGDMIVMFHKTYPPGSETTVDPQGLLQYNLLNNMKPIVLKNGENIGFSAGDNYTVNGAYEISASVSMNGSIKYNKQNKTVSGKFVYKWDGNEIKKEKTIKKTIVYNCSFSNIVLEGDIIKIKTNGTIISTEILESGKPWVNENAGCIQPELKIEKLDDK